MPAAKRTTRIRNPGGAKVISELPITDGSTALEIHGYTLDETGLLDATFRLMRLVPIQWSNGTPVPGTLGVTSLLACEMGGVPELFALSYPAEDGSVGSVWRFAPWDRANGLDSAGWEEMTFYLGASAIPVTWSGKLRVRPCMQQIGERVYFTFGDDSGVFVCDRMRVRKAGFSSPPGPPTVDGPARGSSPNSAGFSAAGRVGTAESSWTDTTGTVAGGVDAYQRRYALVYQGPDGGYSAMSALSAAVTMRLELATSSATPAYYPEDLLRRFRVILAEADEKVQAQILLATPNLDRLNPGDDGSPRFLMRIPHSGPCEVDDNTPDGELGDVWLDRESTPTATFLTFFGGSLFYIRGCRVWWSEQTEQGAFPESILKGHWRDIYAQTGDITAAVTARVRSTQGVPTLLFYKLNAVHYLMGDYPNWQIGTLHESAGCAGWDLVLVLPDGSVVWYGSRTFWAMTPDGNVVDIGGPIRRRLRRINPAWAHLGVAKLDRESAEAIFWLPIDDATTNNYQFIFDFRLKGWRTRADVEVAAATTLPRTDTLIVSGFYAQTTDVFAYKRGYPGSTMTPPTARYITGWTIYSDEDESIGAFYNATQTVWTLQDKGEGTATLSVYRDWNLDEATTALDLSTSSNEDDAIAFYADSTTPAIYGRSVWRSPRTFTQAVHLTEVDGFQAIAVGIETDVPHVLFGAEVLVDPVAGPGQRDRRGPDFSG